MDPTTSADLFLTRAELIEALRLDGQSAETWECNLPADLLEHASAEPLTPEALAALAVARRCFEQATAALLALDHAQLALAAALEAGNP
jgi:hypothetical protein